MTWILKHVAPAIAVAVFAAPVFADTVTLTNGKVLEGHVVENADGETISVELPQGTIRLKRGQIKSIEKKDTPLEEFGRRAADLQKKIKDGALEAPDQIKAWSELAQWAGDNQLPRNREDAYKKVLELDPDNAAARDALGYVLMQGKWLTATERNVALGLVRYEGRWITREALADLKESHDKRVAQQAETDRAQADAELKDAQIQKLQAERDLLNAQREQLSQQLAQQQDAQQQYVPIQPPLYSNTVPLYPYPQPIGRVPYPVANTPVTSGPAPISNKPGLGVPYLNNPNLHQPVPVGLPPPALATPPKLPAPTTPPSQILQPVPAPNPNSPSTPAPAGSRGASDAIPVNAGSSHY